MQRILKILLIYGLDITKQNLNGNDETAEFSVDPGEKLQIIMGFRGFNYYSLSINEESEESRKSNYFEIRSISDFLLLQQVLVKKYNLKLISARPDYRDFW